MVKKDWSGYCATTYNRTQCCADNCILFPICKIKELKEQEQSNDN
jgi:hypothetical protein